MLIRLLEIGAEDALCGALEHPLQKEDRALYVTKVPAYARALAEKQLPCIFVEEWSGDGLPDSDAGYAADSPVYGVDMVVCENDQAEHVGAWRQDEEFLLNIWKRHYGVPWVIAQTGRLLIRESVMEDLPWLLAAYEEERANPDVRSFSGQPEEELRAYIQKGYPFFGYGLWSVVERSSGSVIGRAGVEEKELPAHGKSAGAEDAQAVLELSYLIQKSCRRRGYAKEAAEAILAYVRRELAVREVYLRTSRENTASRRLAERLGFLEDDKLENYFRLDLTDR